MGQKCFKNIVFPRPSSILLKQHGCSNLFRVVCLIDLWKLEIEFNCKFIEFRATFFVPTRAVIKLKLVEIVNMKD